MSRQATAIPSGTNAMRTRPGSPASTGSTMNFRDIMGIVRQRIWLIVIITLLFSVGGVALWAAMLKYKPSYTSYGMVSCKMPVMPDLMGRTGEMMPQAQIIALEIQSKATYLTNRMFLGKVLLRSAVQETAWYKSMEGDPDKRVDSIMERFNASPKRDTEYIVASMRLGDALEAQTVLNEILKEFELDMSKQANDKLLSQLQALRMQRDKKLQEISQAVTRKQDISRTAGTAGFEIGQTVVREELQTWSREQLHLAARLEALRLELARVMANREEGQVSSMVQFQIDQDGIVLGHRSRMSGLQEELDRLLDRFGENHREVQEVKSRIASNQQRLESREAMLREQYTLAEQMQLENQIQITQNQLADATERVDEKTAEQISLDQKRADYISVENEIEVLNQQLSGLDERVGSTQVKLENPDRVTTQVAMWANRPLKVSSPVLPIYGGGGFVLGLLLSVGLVFLLEFMDDTVKSPSDMINHLRMTPLGMIPQYDEEDADAAEVAKVTSIYPHAVISEFYRQLKTNFCSSISAQQQKSMLITSSSADCGKTTTAVNLSIVLANEGAKVLLIDANLRRPKLKSIFAIGSDAGLTDILSGQKAFDQVVAKSGIEGLDVLCSGAVPTNPAQILNCQAMRDLIESQKAKYDHVILDGPPSLLVTDARILGGMVDGVMPVVCASVTARGIVQRMLREMRGVNAHILGIVLNRVRPRRGGYLLKNYQSYYDYIGRH